MAGPDFWWLFGDELHLILWIAEDDVFVLRLEGGIILLNFLEEEDEDDGEIIERRGEEREEGEKKKKENKEEEMNARKSDGIV